MTSWDSLPGPTPQQRRDQLRRLHVESRRQLLRRRRIRVLLVVLVVLAAVLGGAVSVRAYWRDHGAGGGSARPAASPSVATTTTSAPSAHAQVSSSPTAESPAPSPTPTAAPTPVARPRFRAGRAMRDMRALAAFGVRSGGSSAEARGAGYLAMRLRAAGAAVKIRSFPLLNGTTSRNVVARFPGTTTKTIILGAHMDSKHPSPGANDNASGCGALLEIARCLGESRAYPTVEIVLFGTEEMIDSDADHHHYGSRHHVATMTPSAREATSGMVSVDMVGYGSTFAVRTMGRGPQTMRYLLLAEARRRGLRASYLADAGEFGWSDHEPFELAGIPAAWIEWRDDPVYHTAADVSSHISADRIRSAGQFVLSVLYGLDERAIRRLER